MPAKGTKKVRGHTRRKTLFKVGSIEFKDYTRPPTHVKSHYRKKPKRKK